MEVEKLVRVTLPEIAGVKTPSPITAHVPTSAMISKICCNTLLLSKMPFRLAARFADLVGRSSL